MKLRIIVTTMAAVLGASAPVWATDVINQDKKAYTLTIVDGSVTSTKKIAAGGSIYGLCVGSQLMWTPEAVFSQNHSPPAG